MSKVFHSLGYFWLTALIVLISACEKPVYKECASRSYKHWYSPSFVGYLYSEIDTITLRYYRVGSGFGDLVRETRVKYFGTIVHGDTLTEWSSYSTVTFPDTLDTELQLSGAGHMFRISDVRYWGADTGTQRYLIEAEYDCNRSFTAHATNIVATNAAGVVQPRDADYVYFRKQ